MSEKNIPAEDIVIPFVITGIPRSGTSILSKLICENVPNGYCMNEVLYRILLIKRDLMHMGMGLLDSGEIPNKYFGNGELVYNVHENERVEWRKVDKQFDENMLIGSKVTTLYLMYLDILIPQGLKILAMLRDPVYTIASWLSPQSKTMGISQVMSDDMSPRWVGIDFTSNDRVSRMAELWDHMASIILGNKADIEYLKYEELSGERREMGEFWQQIIPFIPEIENYNRKDRYDCDWDGVEVALERYAPTRKEFGY